MGDNFCFRTWAAKKERKASWQSGGGSWRKTRWNGGRLSPIHIPPLTLIAPVWMSQLEGNVKSKHGESAMCELERTFVNSWFNPLILQPSEGVGGVCMLGQRTHLHISLCLFSENHISVVQTRWTACYNSTSPLSPVDMQIHWEGFFGWAGAGPTWWIRNPLPRAAWRVCPALLCLFTTTIQR